MCCAEIKYYSSVLGDLCQAISCASKVLSLYVFDLHLQLSCIYFNIICFSFASVTLDKPEFGY